MTFLKDAGELLRPEIKKIVSEPFIVAGREMFLTLKIGVFNRQVRIKVERNSQRADIALTRCKTKSPAMRCHLQRYKK